MVKKQTKVSFTVILHLKVIIVSWKLKLTVIASNLLVPLLVNKLNKLFICLIKLHSLALFTENKLLVILYDVYVYTDLEIMLLVILYVYTDLFGIIAVDCMSTS